MISFEGGGRRLTARLIGGDFIRYRSRFPAEFACQAEMPAELFMAAVRRVSLVADRASPVRLTFGAGEVAIEAHTDGRARAAETVRADFAGAEPVISFNPHYLLDGIAAAAVCGIAPAARRCGRRSPSSPAQPRPPHPSRPAPAAGGPPPLTTTPPPPMLPPALSARPTASSAWSSTAPPSQPSSPASGLLPSGHRGRRRCGRARRAADESAEPAEPPRTGPRPRTARPSCRTSAT